MSSATLTSKGQITLPVAVRNALGLSTGDRVEFVQVTPGRFELIPATQSVVALRGIVPAPKRPVSIEEMNAAIAAQAGKAS